MILYSANENGLALKLKMFNKSLFLPFAERKYHSHESEPPGCHVTLAKAPELRIYLGEKHDLKALLQSKCAVSAGRAGF